MLHWIVDEVQQERLKVTKHMGLGYHFTWELSKTFLLHNRIGSEFPRKISYWMRIRNAARLKFESLFYSPKYGNGSN